MWEQRAGRSLASQDWDFWKTPVKQVRKQETQWSRHRQSLHCKQCWELAVEIHDSLMAGLVTSYEYAGFEVRSHTQTYKLADGQKQCGPSL